MRLKDYILSGIMLILVLALGSCGEEHGPIDSSGSGGMSVKDEIVLDGVTSQTMNIRASSKPKLYCDADWLSIGEVKKLTTGIYTAELTAQINETGETRSALISVVTGHETATVKVTQTFVDIMEIVGVEPEGPLDPSGGVLAIRYRATGTPAANLPEWIRLAGSRALNEGVLEFTYLANDTGRERAGMIVLAVGKGAVANLEVRQPSL